MHEYTTYTRTLAHTYMQMFACLRECDWYASIRNECVTSNNLLLCSVYFHSNGKVLSY